MLRLVADGKWRLRQSPEFQAAVQALRDRLAARYAAEISQAGFLRRWLLRLRFSRELHREIDRILPSPGSLY